MIPILFPSTQTKFTMTSTSERGTVGGGYGRLTDATSCLVTEDIEGNIELELHYPTSGYLLPYLLQGGIIATLRKKRGIASNSLQAFDIYKTTVNADEVIVNAHHVSYRLSNYIVNGLTSATKNARLMVTYVTGSAEPSLSGWTYSNTGADSPNKTVYSEDTKTVRQYLIDNKYSVKTVFGYEINFNNFNIVSSPPLGVHGAVEVRVGKNLIGGEAVRDAVDTFNAIAPVWRRDGVKVVCSPLIVTPTTPITPQKVALIDYSNEFDTQPTAAELEAYAREYLDTAEPWNPHETLHIEFEQPDSNFFLGDYANVYWGDADVVGTEMQIVQTVYNCLTGRYDSAELGDLETGYVMTAEW